MTDSSHWDDCIALLKSGAPPTQVLPNLRALFQTLPGPKDNLQRNGEGTAAELSPETTQNPVKEALTFRLDQKRPPFTIPYLRPPPFLWDLLRDSDGRLPPECSVFDSEIDFPVLKAFRPRIIPPPPRSVRALLESQSSWQQTSFDSGMPSQENNQRESFSDIDLQSQRVSSSSPSPDTTASPTDQALVHAAQVRQASKILTSALQLPPEAESTAQSQSIQLPPLDTHSWSVAISEVDPNCPISLNAVERLLRQVNQPAFATVVLFSWMPLLMHSYYQGITPNARAEIGLGENPDKFLDILQLAASISDITNWPKHQFAALTELYQALDKESPLPALAQIAILRMAAQP